MTHRELAEKIRQLNATATKQPWCAFDERWFDDGSYDEPYIFTKPRTDEEIKCIATLRVGLKEKAVANADFIVLLRNHADEFADALERLAEAEELLKDARCELGTSNFTTAKVAADAIDAYFGKESK